MGNNSSYRADFSPIPQTVKEYLQPLVGEDFQSAKVIYYSGLSAYTRDPTNIGVLAPSSEGKTYIIVTTTELFDQNDVWSIGGMSPKALVGEHGKLIDQDGNPIQDNVDDLKIEIARAKAKRNHEHVVELKNQLRDLVDQAKYKVSMWNKILVFLEPPHRDLWAHLKPLTSHDKEQMEFHIRDPEARGVYNSTRKVIIEGWPACIFTQAGDESKSYYWDEISTRFDIISPKMNPAKYALAIQLTSRKKGLPPEALEALFPMERLAKAKKDTENLCLKLLSLSTTMDFKRTSQFHNFTWNPILLTTAQSNGSGQGVSFPHEKGSRMRQANRLASYCNIIAAMRDGRSPRLRIANTSNSSSVDYPIVTWSDFAEAFYLVKDLEGIPPYKLDFFEKIFKPLCSEVIDKSKDSTVEGVTARQLADRYYQVSKKRVSKDSVRKTYLVALENAGLIDSKSDPEDQRQIIYFPTANGALTGLQTTGGIPISQNFGLESLGKAWNDLTQLQNPIYQCSIIADNGESPVSLSIEDLYKQFFIEGEYGSRINAAQKNPNSTERGQNSGRIDISQISQDLNLHTNDIRNETDQNSKEHNSDHSSEKEATPSVFRRNEGEGAEFAEQAEVKSEPKEKPIAGTNVDVGSQSSSETSESSGHSVEADPKIYLFNCPCGQGPFINSIAAEEHQGQCDAYRNTGGNIPKHTGEKN